ncbi:MAG: hypothetical protein ACLGI8_15635 [Acidimicrobiia bacterium]
MPDLSTQPSVRVVPWPDPLVEAAGHDPRSPYVERYWLGVLGPTATWLVRRLAERLEAEPDGFELDLPALAAELGVGHRGGRQAPFLRTLERCARFGLLEIRPHAIRVRRRLPELSALQLDRLPPHLRQAHRQETGRTTHSVDELRERARGFALSLLDQGATPVDAERDLHRRGVHPAMAADAVRWAVDHRSATLSSWEGAPPAA